MNKIIKKFLKEQQLNSGQLYKICPDKFLKEFLSYFITQIPIELKEKLLDLSKNKK